MVRVLLSEICFSICSFVENCFCLIFLVKIFWLSVECIMTKVVVYWVDSNKVSIEELGKINDEDRYVGAPTSIKCGTRYHKAIVRLISNEYFF